MISASIEFPYTASIREGTQRPQLTLLGVFLACAGTQLERFHSFHILPFHPALYHFISPTSKEIYSQTFYKAELDKMIRSSTCSSSSYIFGGGADWQAAAHFPLHSSSAVALMWEAVRIDGRGGKGEEGRVFFLIKHCVGVSLPASIFQNKSPPRAQEGEGVHAADAAVVKLR